MPSDAIVPPSPPSLAPPEGDSPAPLGPVASGASGAEASRPPPSLRSLPPLPALEPILDAAAEARERGGGDGALEAYKKALFLVSSPQESGIDRLPPEEQKRFLRRTFTGIGWESDTVLAVMEDTPDFYFDSVTQIRMDSWSAGRVTLLGDARADGARDAQHHRLARTVQRSIRARRRRRREVQLSFDQLDVYIEHA